MNQRQLSANPQEDILHIEGKHTVDQDEEAIRAKMEELRKHSHSGVTDAKLRQGALLALGLK
jgi:hypothetical protein